MLRIKLAKKFHLLCMSSALACSGCVNPPDSIDRFEAINRPIYNLNRTADRYVLKPAARIYEGILPKPIQQGVGNFFQNLSEIPNVANDLLQGKFSLARADASRFIVNSTWGIAGIFDAASKGVNPIPRHHQDFGMTLAKWGYRDSSYLVIPLFGPSTIRDGIGKLGTYSMGVPAYMRSVRWRNRLFALNMLQTRAALLKAEPAIGEAVDEYVFVRDAYLQHRQYEIKGHMNVEDREAKLQGPPE
jgi:phospholipid-binding lipoprotein MlaA